MANCVLLVLFFLHIIAFVVPFPSAAEANEGFEVTSRQMHTIPFTDDDTECMTNDTCTSTTECSLPQCMCITKINPDAQPFCISKDCTGKPCNEFNECVYPDCTCNTDGEKPLCQSG